MAITFKYGLLRFWGFFEAQQGDPEPPADRDPPPTGQAGHPSSAAKGDGAEAPKTPGTAPGPPALSPRPQLRQRDCPGWCQGSEQGPQLTLVTRLPSATILALPGGM